MINLLPKKYVKNRAPLVVGIIVSCLLIVVLAILLIQFFMLSSQIKQAEQTLSFEKQQTAKVANQVNKLEKSRSLSIKEELASIKSSKYDVTKIMTTFSETMDTYKINMLSYQLALDKVDGLSTELMTTTFNEQGQEIMQIDFSTEESSLSTLGECIEAFRRVEWIDDAKFVMASNNELYNSTIYMNLLVENLPQIGGK